MHILKTQYDVLCIHENYIKKKYKTSELSVNRGRLTHIEKKLNNCNEICTRNKKEFKGDIVEV